MAIDYDALSKQELEALLAGNYDALSKETLQMIIDVEEQAKKPRLDQKTDETTGVKPEKEEPSFLQNVLAGIESAGIRFGTRGAYAPPDETAQYFASAEAKEKARKAALIESGADPESFGYMGGELLATAPMAGPLIRGGAAVLEQVVPRAAPLAASIRSGGFKTTLPATAPTAARVGIQAAGGATAATVPTILTEPEQTTEAALTGAVLGPAAPVLAKAGARTFGKTVDLLSGKTPELRAARRARAMAGEKVNELRAALSAAPAGTTPSQVAADIDAPALQTLLQKAEELDPNQVARTVRRLQGEDLVRELERIAGGATATESRQTRELGKKALDEITGKMREQELRAAGAAARLKPKIESVAGRAREAASEAVQDVRRSESMINSALRWAKDWAPGGARQPGAPRGPTQYTYPGELAGRAEEFGKEAAEESLRQGAKARFAEAAAQRLEESGLKPLTAEKLFNSISAKLRNPDIATNPTAAKALNRLSDMLIDWSDEYGAITPEALYAIRKNGVTGIIDELMPGADENARRRLTQKVMTELKPLIDDAIEEAGGKDWRNYLKTFEQGMQTLSRRELGNEARLMFKENPKGFIALVRGENPEAVEEVFGPGSYDIVKEMAENMGVLRKGAEYLEKEARIEAQARAGQAAYDEIARRQEYKIRFPWLTRFTTGLNEQFRRWEGKIDNRTIDILVNAARSNADFKKLIETIPTQYRSAVLRNISNPEEWNEFAGLVTNAIATYQEENPEAELKFARGGPVRYSPQEEMLLRKYAR